MAKPAKAAQVVEVTPKIVNGLIKLILESHSDLESARGSFMNKARRIRETIQATIDSGAARGIPPKMTKLMIKIEQLQAKLKTNLAELDSEERKLMKRIVIAHGSKEQLALFSDLPEAAKPEKPVVIKETKAKGGKGAKATGEKVHPGVTGEDLDKNAVASGEAPATLN